MNSDLRIMELQEIHSRLINIEAKLEKITSTLFPPPSKNCYMCGEKIEQPNTLHNPTYCLNCNKITYPDLKPLTMFHAKNT